MPRYVRMWFRDQKVWAQVQADGGPQADAEGRVEIRFRLDDRRAYRAARANLRPIPGEVPVDATSEAAPGTPRARARGGAPARRGTRAGATSAAGAGAADVPPPREGSRPILVYTDGACTGNPGPMGLGVVLTADGERKEISEYLGVGTNNIAELTAVLRALEAIQDRDRPVRIHSDSTYVIGVLAQGFKAKANRDLIERLRRAMTGFADLRFVKVEGHAGVAENERCDELAREAIARRG